MFITVGNSFISLCTSVTGWLASNFIGTYYMFCILVLFFMVIYTLGGHNR